MAVSLLQQRAVELPWILLALVTLVHTPAQPQEEETVGVTTLSSLLWVSGFCCRKLFVVEECLVFLSTSEYSAVKLTRSVYP